MKAQSKDAEPKIILNWGCGHSKNDQWINIDYNHSTGPDFAESITRIPWDWETSSVDMLILNHVIEHTSKGFHNPILAECNRILKMGGELFIAYPEFERCATAFINNKHNRREFWEWTIYGRQVDAGDFHISAITDRYMKAKLLDTGFQIQSMKSNDRTEEYTDCLAVKHRECVTYEALVGSTYGPNKE